MKTPKTLHFPAAQEATLTRAKAAEAENKILREFLEKVQASNIDGHIRMDRLEATMNAILRELKRGRKK